MGELVIKKYHITQMDPETKEMVTYDIRTGEEVARNGKPAPKALFAYTLEVADTICYFLREGKSMNWITKQPNLPNRSIIYKWIEVHPDFAERVKRAKSNRAEYFRDKAEEVLERADDLTIKSDKLKFDGYMKLAEKDNPVEYGSVQKAGGGSAPLQIIVQTGINREPTTVEVVNEREDGENPEGRESNRISSIVAIAKEDGGETSGREEARQEKESNQEGEER